MTVGESVFAVLSPLVDGRVFPVTAPFSTQRPYITYQQIGGRVIVPVAQVVPDKQNGFFQVNAWCDVIDDADALALQIEAAFITAEAFLAKPMSGQIDMHEPDIGIYGKQQEFSVWSDR